MSAKFGYTQRNDTPIVLPLLCVSGNSLFGGSRSQSRCQSCAPKVSSAKTRKTTPLPCSNMQKFSVIGKTVSFTDNLADRRSLQLALHKLYTKSITPGDANSSQQDNISCHSRIKQTLNAGGSVSERQIVRMNSENLSFYKKRGAQTARDISEHCKHTISGSDVCKNISLPPLTLNNTAKCKVKHPVQTNSVSIWCRGLSNWGISVADLGEGVWKNLQGTVCKTCRGYSIFDHTSYKCLWSGSPTLCGTSSSVLCVVTCITEILLIMTLLATNTLTHKPAFGR